MIANNCPRLDNKSMKSNMLVSIVLAAIPAIFFSVWVNVSHASSSEQDGNAQSKTTVASATQPASTQPTTAPAFVLDKRILVILMAGDNKPDMTPEQRMDIQKQHLAHLTKMWEQGHMIVAGPFGNQSDKRMRGLCLYRIPDGDPSGHLDKVRALAESDPAVQAGVLKVEVMVWYFEKDAVTFKYESKKND